MVSILSKVVDRWPVTDVTMLDSPCFLKHIEGAVHRRDVHFPFG
jgi:hypothetical protein